MAHIEIDTFNQCITSRRVFPLKTNSFYLWQDKIRWNKNSKTKSRSNRPVLQDGVWQQFFFVAVVSRIFFCISQPMPSTIESLAKMFLRQKNHHDEVILSRYCFWKYIKLSLSEFLHTFDSWNGSCLYYRIQ